MRHVELQGVEAGLAGAPHRRAEQLDDGPGFTPLQSARPRAARPVRNGARGDQLPAGRLGQREIDAVTPAPRRATSARMPEPGHDEAGAARVGSGNDLRPRAHVVVRVEPGRPRGEPALG